MPRPFLATKIVDRGGVGHKALLVWRSGEIVHEERKHYPWFVANKCINGKYVMSINIFIPTKVNTL
jgi:hypothetical protein